MNGYDPGDVTHQINRVMKRFACVSSLSALPEASFITAVCAAQTQTALYLYANLTAIREAAVKLKQQLLLSENPGRLVFKCIVSK